MELDISFCLALVLYCFNFKTDKSVTEKFFCRSSQALCDFILLCKEFLSKDISCQVP